MPSGTTLDNDVSRNKLAATSLRSAVCPVAVARASRISSLKMKRMRWLNYGCVDE
jgi:hypothetical protein